MLLDKPPWVAHDASRGDVYGIDVSADGARFATAGGDHKVKLWALPPVLSAAAEAAPGAPKLLATLAEHFGPVNALRFSGSGRRLATGSDDKLVLVHELRPGPPRAVFGATDAPAVENWQARPKAAVRRTAHARGADAARRCARAPRARPQVVMQLRGHANNVTDVAWSPDDALLASASLDNYVFVWNAEGARVATLAGAPRRRGRGAAVAVAARCGAAAQRAAARGGCRSLRVR
jgi:protein HIRA/HIR1